MINGTLGKTDSSSPPRTNGPVQGFLPLVHLQKVTKEKPKQGDPAGMPSKLCSGYLSLLQSTKPSEEK
jgi:hypothetical protein